MAERSSRPYLRRSGEKLRCRQGDGLEDSFFFSRKLAMSLKRFIRRNLKAFRMLTTPLKSLSSISFVKNPGTYYFK